MIAQLQADEKAENSTVVDRVWRRKGGRRRCLFVIRWLDPPLFCGRKYDVVNVACKRPSNLAGVQGSLRRAQVGLQALRRANLRSRLRQRLGAFLSLARVYGIEIIKQKVYVFYIAIDIWTQDWSGETLAVVLAKNAELLTTRHIGACPHHSLTCLATTCH